MENIKTLLLAGIFLTCFSSIGYAREGANYAFKVSLSGKIYRQLSFAIEEDLRTDVSFSPVQWLLSTAEVNYKLIPAVKAGIAYQHLLSLESSSWHRHRYFLYITGSQSFGNLKLSLRERFQSTFAKQAHHPSNYLRSMLMLSYRISRSAFTPFAYAETYNQVGHGGKIKLARLRLSAGCDYRLDSHNQLQFYYRYHFFYAPDAVNSKNGIGITFSHRF